MRKTYYLLFVCLLSCVASLQAQQKQKFSVTSFGLDPFDTTAKSDRYKKVDGSGDLMALIKVTSATPDDDLQAYTFNFGILNHEVVVHDDDELWVYVQRNARLVTISREGYTTVSKYSLGESLQEGLTYNMVISAQARRVQYQMVQFNVVPKNIGAVVLVKNSKPGATKEKFGAVDSNGSVAKALEYGFYTYEVVADDYLLSENSFTLDDSKKTHVENVELRPNFADITLQGTDGADIYINDERKGQGSWTGRLKAGSYVVESRLKDHRPAIMSVTVVAGEPQTITLTPPTPIVGNLSVTSTPLGADIRIDGQAHGATPQIIADIPIGQHRLELALKDYKSFTQTVDIKENQTTLVEATMESLVKPKPVVKTEPEPVVKQEPKTEKGPEPKPVKDPKPKTTKQPKPDNGKPLFAPSSFYAQAGIQVGSLMAIPLSVGGYISNFNIEATYALGLSKSDDVYWNPSSDPDADPVQCNYKPTLYGLKLGYGIIATRSIRLTPQVGATVVSLKADGSKANATTATLGLRAELAVASHVSLYAAPEMGFALAKSDVYSQLIDASSKIKSWAGGFNCRLGLCISF